MYRWCVFLRTTLFTFYLEQPRKLHLTLRMPLDEIPANKVAIPRGPTTLIPAPKRPRRGAPHGHTRCADGRKETDYNVKIAIIVARLLYKESWQQIEERFSSLGVKKSTAASIYMKAWEGREKG